VIDERQFETEEFLLYRLPNVARRVSKICEAEYATEFGLKVGEWRLMSQVSRFKSISAKEVSERISMDAVSISRAAYSCISRGLIQEAPDVRDRRSKKLSLTPAGKAFMRRFQPYACALAERMEKGLTSSEIKTFKGLLKKLERHLLTMTPEVDAEISAA
jgi:DNA-binding MarR family transcriptional regulator